MQKAPIPVHILTGFLGSGKSTLLNHLVQSKEFSKTLVIINEFGEIGIDHLLVKSSDEAHIEMSSGCICCTIRGDLQKTLKDVKWRFARQGKRQFDRVIIETTGLADPAPIIHTILNSPGVSGDYEMRSIITTIDATCFAQTQEAQFEACKQAAVADSLIITKTDLVDEEQVLNTEQLVRTFNPSAPIIRTSNGAVAIEPLLSTEPFSILNKNIDVKKWLDEEAYQDQQHLHHHEDHGHEHGHHEHHHDITRHGKSIQSFCVTHDDPIPEERFAVWLELLVALKGKDILRVKGIVNIEGEDGPLILHGVQHIFYPFVRLNAWPDNDRRTRIVFIINDIAKNDLDLPLSSFASMASGG